MLETEEIVDLQVLLAHGTLEAPRLLVPQRPNLEAAKDFDLVPPLHEVLPGVRRRPYANFKIFEKGLRYLDNLVRDNSGLDDVDPNENLSHEAPQFYEALFRAVVCGDKENFAAELERTRQLLQQTTPTLNNQGIQIDISPEQLGILSLKGLSEGQRSRVESFARLVKSVSKWEGELQIGNVPTFTQSSKLETGEEETVTIKVTPELLSRLKHEVLRVYGDELSKHPESKVIFDRAMIEALGLPSMDEFMRGLKYLLDPDLSKREAEIARKNAELEREKQKRAELLARLAEEKKFINRLRFRLGKGLSLIGINIEALKPKPVELKSQEPLILSAQESVSDSQTEPSKDASDWINDLLDKPL